MYRSCRVADGRQSARPVDRLSLVLATSATLMLALGACSQGNQSSTPGQRIGSVDARLGTSPSPRLAEPGMPIQKGGGTYKLGPPYRVAGRWYVPQEDPRYDRTGRASWYGPQFHGRQTANGELYDMNALSAAHPTLPLPCYAYVTNLQNGRTILVRINDRGPYANNRIIDLSREAARQLDFHVQGTTDVRVRYAGHAPLDGNDAYERRFLASQPWQRLAGAGRWYGRSSLSAAGQGLPGL